MNDTTRTFTITDLAGNKLGWARAENGYCARKQFVSGTDLTVDDVKVVR
jgi:hypothetical protein